MTHESPEMLAARLLDACLPNLAFDGFNSRTIAQAARALDLDETAVAVALPRGGIDLACLYAARLDQQLTTALGPMDLPSMKIRLRIATALKTRLQLIGPSREIHRRLIQCFASPSHASDGLKCLYNSADAIWLAAGDTATDFNFHTKRIILSGVLSATDLFWLQDDSADYVATQEFIDRRINDVMQIEKVKAQVRQLGDKMPDLTAALAKLRYGFSFSSGRASRR
jgi:ubiquinone biosynthesis protein COQ9